MSSWGARIAAAIAALISIATLVLGIIGFFGKGGLANVDTAVPNSLTGIVSILAVLAYIGRRSLWLVLAVLGLIGHLYASVAQLLKVAGLGPIVSGKMIGLFGIPIIWALLIVSMFAFAKPTQPIQS